MLFFAFAVEFLHIITVELKETLIMHLSKLVFRHGIKSVKCSEHQVSNCHQQSLVSWTAYRSGKGIQSALDEATQAQFKQNEAQRVMNREYFKKLVDIVLTLAKCGKPFRGHVEAETSKNRGLFLEIFSLVKRHCPELEAYASNAPKNCTYLSNRI